MDFRQHSKCTRPLLRLLAQAVCARIRRASEDEKLTLLDASSESGPLVTGDAVPEKRAQPPTLSRNSRGGGIARERHEGATSSADEFRERSLDPCSREGSPRRANHDGAVECSSTRAALRDNRDPEDARRE